MIKTLEKITQPGIFGIVETAKRFNYDLILLHHTATITDFKTPDGLYGEEIDYIHRNGRREGYPPFVNGMGYHFLVNADGRVQVGDRWIKQLYGAHCKGRNATTLGICMVGNFNEVYPTNGQIDSVGQLLAVLKPVKVDMHRNYRQTDCPGTNIDIEYWNENFKPLIPWKET